MMRNSHTHFISVLLNIIYISIYILYHHHRQYNKQCNTFSIVENTVAFPLFYTTYFRKKANTNWHHTLE
jgi:hypothetical protein